MTEHQLQVEAEPELTISVDHQHYIQSLNESPECYARFFDALLIRKSSHADFFHDLKVFREQPVVIRLLEPGSKEQFRECTVVFLGSRFAHPWCRSSAAHSSGWTKASWIGRTKKLTTEAKKEEEKLHRLLVPLWIAFRRRMFPEQEVLQKWVDEEPARQLARQAKLEAEKETQVPKNASGLNKNDAPTNVYPELGFATASTSSSAPRNDTTPSNNQSTAAGQMFLGVAVTGFIMSDKRVKKYVEKKLKKYK
jgi:hypothetical protein